MRIVHAVERSPIDLMLAVWPPMKADLADASEIGAGWSIEEKYDGFRAVAAIAAPPGTVGTTARRVALQSRRGLDLSARFPAVAAALASVPVAEAVLDGEVVALDGDGIARFQLLQGGGGTLRYVVFDLLWIDGEDVRAKPLEDRRGRLRGVLAGVGPPIAVASPIGATLGEAMARARRRRTEGVVVKRIGSAYRPGSRAWRKVKVLANQELAIVGFNPITTGARAVGALHLATFEAGHGFEYAGKVGTGFSDAVRRELWRTLEPDRLDRRPPFAPRAKEAIWVEPRHVAQIAFSDWTAAGRVRQPSFQGLREDKTPRECVRERPAGASGFSRAREE